MAVVNKKKISKQSKKAPAPKVPEVSVERADAEQETESESDGEGESDEEPPKQTLSEAEEKQLLKQVSSEWETGWWFIKPKWDEWALRLRLYNNQKRDKDAVGDNTLFTVFNTVLAAIYNDRLSVTFGAREAGDVDVAENLNITAVNDYDEMSKNELDYEWDWEAAFFGRSLLCMMTFDREGMAPIPEVWNVMSVIRDPEAKSVNGSPKTGKGRARFLYREMRMSKNDLEEADVYYNIENLKRDTTSSKSIIDEYMRVTADAAGLSGADKFRSIVGENETMRLVEGFTIFKKKRVFVTIGNDFKTVVRYEVLEDMDIPIVDRAIYPIPGSWDGVSIPDLVEDKQRGRAVAINLSLKGVKASLHPMYLYDLNKIKNKSDLNFDFNKFIGVNGDTANAVSPMQRDHIKQDVGFILETLSNGADSAAATPDVRKGGGVSGGKQTATHDALLNQGTDTRYSLSVKIFGWSEKRFWRMWYSLYKRYMAEGIDQKIVRLSGALGATWRPLTKENLMTERVDPDITIESTIISDAQRYNDLQSFTPLLNYIMMDPNANHRVALKYYGKLQNIKKDVLDVIIPPTIEEMRAEEENDLLEQDQIVEVLPTDDHMQHLYIHNKVQDSQTKTAHMNAHKRAMLIQKMRPDLIAPPTAPGRVPEGTPNSTPDYQPERVGQPLPVRGETM